MRAIVLKVLIVTVLALSVSTASGDVGAAIVSGNGYGRPVTVTIAFYGADGGFNTTPATWRTPDSVTLRWPGICVAALSSTSTAITVVARDTLSVAFPPAVFSDGFTGVNGPTAIVTIYGAIEAGTEYSPNAIIDAIGPLIGRSASGSYCGIGPFMNPTFEENKSPGVTSDVLRLQLTETLADLAQLVGNSILISSDSLGTAEKPLTVASATLVAGVVLLTLAPTSVLEPYYWIRLNPAVIGITDAAGNRVAADNRRVQIFQTEAPARIIDAWYTTADNTGIIDAAYISFDKRLTDASIPAWFSGGSFSFTWDGVGTFNVNTDNIASITLEATIPNTIRINMAAAMSPVELNKMTGGKVRTGGVMTVGVTFGPVKGWPNANIMARDAARPVLVSAVLLTGLVNDRPDTLILKFSEPNMGDMSIINPVSIQTDGSWNPVAVRANALGLTQTLDGLYRVVTYVVDRFEGGVPKEGDWVKINELAGVADGVTPPNVQNNADNRRVPLGINGEVSVLTPDRVIPTAKPNEMATVIAPVVIFAGEFTAGPNPVLRRAGVVNFYRQGKRVANCELRIYDATGNIINKVKISDNAFGNQARRKVGTWDLCDKNGRIVSDGTYLVKGVVKTSDGKSEKASLILGVR